MQQVDKKEQQKSQVKKMLLYFFGTFPSLAPQYVMRHSVTEYMPSDKKNIT